jgi:hypothetical protein
MIPKPGDVWRLTRGDAVVAELVVDGPDMPWLVGHVRADPAFEALRPHFVSCAAWSTSQRGLQPLSGSGRRCVS